MRMKTAIAALALIALPAIAVAECSWGHKNQSVSQCPQGQSFDPVSAVCVPSSTS